jgi:hypothetical protein
MCLDKAVIACIIDRRVITSIYVERTQLGLDLNTHYLCCTVKLVNRLDWVLN